MKDVNCPTNLNARWCDTEKRWRIPSDRCLACSESDCVAAGTADEKPDCQAENAIGHAPGAKGNANE